MKKFIELGLPTKTANNDGYYVASVSNEAWYLLAVEGTLDGGNQAVAHYLFPTLAEAHRGAIQYYQDNNQTYPHNIDHCADTSVKVSIQINRTVSEIMVFE